MFALKSWLTLVLGCECKKKSSSINQLHEKLGLPPLISLHTFYYYFWHLPPLKDGEVIYGWPQELMTRKKVRFSIMLMTNPWEGALIKNAAVLLTNNSSQCKCWFEKKINKNPRCIPMTLCFGISITWGFKSVNTLIELLQETFYFQPNKNQ